MILDRPNESVLKPRMPPKPPKHPKANIKRSGRFNFEPKFNQNASKQYTISKRLDPLTETQGLASSCGYFCNQCQ